MYATWTGAAAHRHVLTRDDFERREGRAAAYLNFGAEFPLSCAGDRRSFSLSALGLGGKRRAPFSGSSGLRRSMLARGARSSALSSVADGTAQLPAPRLHDLDHGLHVRSYDTSSHPRLGGPRARAPRTGRSVQQASASDALAPARAPTPLFPVRSARRVLPLSLARRGTGGRSSPVATLARAATLLALAGVRTVSARLTRSARATGQRVEFLCRP